MPSSCCQITRSTGVAPRPPYSLGQCRQTQPPSAFFFCHAFPTSTISPFCNLMRPSEDLESSASNSFGALARIHWRASARNAASCGVSSKFMVDLSSSEISYQRLVLMVRRRPCAVSNHELAPSFETPRSARLLRMRPFLSSSPGRYLVERYVLVDPDIAGQSEHALGDDVAHDLVGTAFDPGTGRAQHHVMEFSGNFRVLRSTQHARGTLQVQRIGRDVLDHGTCDQFTDRILRSRPLALRQRRDRA